MRVALLASVANFTVTVSTNVINSNSHDVRVGDTISLATTGTLPAPLASDASDQIYYAYNVAANTFQLVYAKAEDALSNQGVSFDVATDTISFSNHGFVDDDRVEFTTTGALPTGLSLETHYYVVNASQNFFQVSTTEGGAAVNFSGTPSGTATAATGTPAYITNTGTGTHSYQSGVSLNPSETPEIRRYVLTYVAKYGEVEMESAPSLPSVDTATWRTGQRVILTSMPTGPGTGNFNIINKRIYRINTSDTSAEYQFVAEVELSQTEFIDDLEDLDLGEVIATEDYDMPPYDMEGIKPMANGMIVGFNGNQINYNEPYRVHAWPISYRRNTHYPIVGIGIYGQMGLQPYSFGLITTEQYPYTVYGTTPDTMIMNQVEIPYPCVSKRSIVDMGQYGVMYASSDGLVLASAKGIDLATRLGEGVWSITPAQWRAKKPATIVGSRWDQYYMGYYDDGSTQEGFLFDPATKDFIFLDDFASAIALNPQTGALHIFSDSKIQSWDTGAAQTATWKDKKRFTSSAVAFTAARVVADSYSSVTLVVDADGSEVENVAVTADEPFIIDTGDLANTFELELQTADDMQSVEMAGDIEQLLGE